jgi:hypothetical protein
MGDPHMSLSEEKEKDKEERIKNPSAPLSLSSFSDGGKAAAAAGGPPMPAIPRCTFVTGPRRSGRTRCIQQRLAACPSPARAAVLVIDDGGLLARHSDDADFPDARVNKLTLPCPCCPELAGLPVAVRSMCGVPGEPVSHLFIKIPDIAAPRLLAEFDRMVGWPRTLVVCLSAAWARVRAAQQTLPLFLSTLLALADEIITPPADTGAADDKIIPLTL